MADKPYGIICANCGVVYDNHYCNYNGNTANDPYCPNPDGTNALGTLGSWTHPNTVGSAPINNHVCPTCKNDRVSKVEKAKGIPCWKCGGKL